MLWCSLAGFEGRWDDERWKSWNNEVIGGMSDGELLVGGR
jgi:hypothetical protein